ncbi:hydroxysteroid 11-beta-dehydrogenase 1-like protein A [Lineus longissimus]|uniref:hydroxysteroid 11-beta-dehydrogenase 1-like protein A n=1 Tax=Lineus longissimus TaxID=88925 RepID=UPI002B4C7518
MCFTTMDRKFIAIVCLVVAMVIGYYSIDRFDPELIRGKRVLVTGGSAGIGEQISYQYARLGAKVVVTARTVKNLKRVVSKCKELSGSSEHHYIAADMANLDETERVIREATTLLGGLDILILNHVAPYQFGWWEGSENLTAFNTRTTIGYLSHVHLTSHALPILRKTPGSNIVVLSSMAGIMGYSIQADYAGVKFAQNGFFKSLRDQFSVMKEDIAVTVCFLGAISTESFAKALENVSLGGLYEDLIKSTPEDTSYTIVRAAQLRLPELYHPYWFVKLGTWPVTGEIFKWVLSQYLVNLG